jgi:hypothetical protein
MGSSRAATAFVVRSTIVAKSLVRTALLASEDHREGLAALRERRRAEFVGR